MNQILLVALLMSILVNFSLSCTSDSQCSASQCCPRVPNPIGFKSCKPRPNANQPCGIFYCPCTGGTQCVYPRNRLGAKIKGTCQHH